LTLLSILCHFALPETGVYVATDFSSNFNTRGDKLSAVTLPRDEFTIEEASVVTALFAEDILPFYRARLIVREKALAPDLGSYEDSENKVAGRSDYNFYLRLERAAVSGGIPQGVHYFWIKGSRSKAIVNDHVDNWDRNDRNATLDILQRFIKFVPQDLWRRGGVPLNNYNTPRRPHLG
jgi:hypothetical protein